MYFISKDTYWGKNVEYSVEMENKIEQEFLDQPKETQRTTLIRAVRQTENNSKTHICSLRGPQFCAPNSGLFVHSSFPIWDILMVFYKIPSNCHLSQLVLNVIYLLVKSQNLLWILKINKYFFYFNISQVFILIT